MIYTNQIYKTFPVSTVPLTRGSRPVVAFQQTSMALEVPARQCQAPVDSPKSRFQCELLTVVNRHHSIMDHQNSLSCTLIGDIHCILQIQDPVISPTFVLHLWIISTVASIA